MAPDPIDDDTPLTAPAGAGLDRHRRRALFLRAVARILGITVLLLVAYFAAPVGQDADTTGLVVLTVGLIGFVALLGYQIKRILDSPMPQLRAAETLATVVPLVIVVFALFYVAMSSADPSGFSEPITKVNGLYFTVTVLSTVGFGDITALTDGPRLAVTVQMVLDLLIVGVLVKVIIGASRIAVERRRAEAEASARATTGDAAGSDPSDPPETTA
jgi:voltage-gated potassium channel